MDKFLIAENPLTDHGTTAVIRTVKPLSIYQVQHDPEKPAKKLNRQYRYRDQLITVSLYKSEDPDLPEETALKQIDDAWHWYRALLDHKHEKDAV